MRQDDTRLSAVWCCLVVLSVFYYYRLQLLLAKTARITQR